MAKRYAEGTDVPAEQSEQEIRRLLSRRGASSFASGWEGNVHVIGFRLYDRYVRIRLTLPSTDDMQFQYTPEQRYRSPEARSAAYEREVRRRWRVLLLAIKTKLELVESDVLSMDEDIARRFEREFLPYIVLPDGRTYGEYALPQIEQVYRSGDMPALLPGLRPNDIRALGEGTQA